MTDVKYSCLKCGNGIAPNKCVICTTPNPSMVTVATVVPRYYLKCSKCGGISLTTFGATDEAILTWNRGETAVPK